MENTEEFDLFMASINKSNRSSSPTSIQSSTSSPNPNLDSIVNHHSNYTKPSPKKKLNCIEKKRMLHLIDLVKNTQKYLNKSRKKLNGFLVKITIL